MQAGFERAYGTILDANITTFMATAIMFQVGSGPVRGFAVTLMIGVITSVYTAVTVTRFIHHAISAPRPSRQHCGLAAEKRAPMFRLKFVPLKTNIPFIGMRNITFAVSALLHAGLSCAVFHSGAELRH